MEWRRQLKGCDLCTVKGCSTPPSSGPRYGTGKLYQPEVAFVATNPPAELLRAQEGAFMLHYPRSMDDVRSKSEFLLLELLERLGLQPMDVYATQVVKCPTATNTVCSQMIDDCSGRWLDEELTALAPKVIVCLGLVARIGTHRYASLKWDLKSQVRTPDTWLCRGTSDKVPETHLRLYRNHGWVHLPHPSTVGRFCDRNDWLTFAAEAISKARGV